MAMSIKQQSSGRTFALVTCAILAAGGRSASGSIIFTPNSANCGTSSSGGSTGGLDTSPIDMFDGVQGIKIFGNCSAFFSSEDIEFGPQPSLDFELPPQNIFAAVSGLSGGSDTFLHDFIHISWNFSSASDLFGDINWTVWIEINGLPEIFGGTAEPGVDVIGEADISVPQGAALLNWAAGIGLQEDGIANSDSLFALLVPHSSLDIAVGPATAPIAPEPATFFVTGSALVLSYVGRKLWPKKPVS
jgi:hypothetical protein